MAGGVVGGLIGGPLGILLGGALGHSGETPPPYSLEESLRRAFKERDLQFVELYRHGPFQIEVSFLIDQVINGSVFWTVGSIAPRVSGWKQVDLDDWLYGDLVDEQLDPWLQAYRVRIL
jgi:hypothetical protein